MTSLAKAAKRNPSFTLILLKPDLGAFAWLGFDGFRIAQGAPQLFHVTSQPDGRCLQTGKRVPPIFRSKSGEALVHHVDRFLQIDYSGTYRLVMKQRGITGRFGAGTTASHKSGGDGDQGELTAIHSASSQVSTRCASGYPKAG